MFRIFNARLTSWIPWICTVFSILIFGKLVVHCIGVQTFMINNPTCLSVQKRN